MTQHTDDQSRLESVVRTSFEIRAPMKLNYSILLDMWHKRVSNNFTITKQVLCKSETLERLGDRLFLSTPTSVRNVRR